MFPVAPQILLADVVQVIGTVLGFFALIMWVIKQIAEANRKVVTPRGRPPDPSQQKAQRPPELGEQPAGQQADPLRSQVEEFLRRRNPQTNPAGPQSRRPRPAQSSGIELLVSDEPDAKQRRALAEPLRSSDPPGRVPLQQPAAAERWPSLPRRPDAGWRESVAEHVAESVAAGTLALGEHASRLGHRIVDEDQQFDVQLKARFDHPVGTLTGSGVAAAERAAAAAAYAASPAAQIAVLLSTSEGVQQAMVINEILRRPSDRW